MFVTPRGVQNFPCPEEEVCVLFAESKGEDTMGDVRDS
jgi:hypothetical protein